MNQIVGKIFFLSKNCNLVREISMRRGVIEGTPPSGILALLCTCRVLYPEARAQQSFTMTPIG